MLLSAVPVLGVAQSSSEIPEGLMNNPVHIIIDGGIQAALTPMQMKDVPALAIEVYGGDGVYSSQP